MEGTPRTLVVSICLGQKEISTYAFWKFQKGGQNSRQSTVVWQGLKWLSAPLMLSEILISLGKCQLMQGEELQQVRSYFGYNRCSFLASGNKLVTEKQLLFPAIHLWHVPPTSPGMISPVYFTLQATPLHKLTQSYHSSCPWPYLAFPDSWKDNSFTAFSFTEST